MSKGTPIRHFRMLNSEWREMLETIELRNLFTREERWDKSAFITLAIREKIAKMERSRGGRKASVALARIRGDAQLLEALRVEKTLFDQGQDH